MNDEQSAAVRTLTISPIAILTGAPGTGKTVTIKALSAILECAGYQVYLTAPTGRAAARLSEETGKPAQTLHRLLHNHRQQQQIRDLIIITDKLHSYTAAKKLILSHVEHRQNRYLKI